MCRLFSFGISSITGGGFEGNASSHRVEACFRLDTESKQNVAVLQNSVARRRTILGKKHLTIW